MNIYDSAIEGAYILENNYIEDERGYFLRVFDNKELEKYNLNFNLIHSNINYNKKAGTIRGMHYQKEPYAEIKVVRCLKGRIYDVVIDIRKSSSTYGKKFTSRETLVKMIEDYIEYYNHKRLQRNLGVLTPFEKHEQYMLVA